MKTISLCLILASTYLHASNPKPLAKVFVDTAKLSKVSQTLLFPALVKSRIESNIRADGDLIVIKPHVSLGQRVKKGDVLLELRNQDTSMHFNNRMLRAPVAGVVAALMVGTGEYVQKGQQLALINDPNQLYLKLEMPLNHHQEVLPGISANVLSQNESETIKAKVTGVGAVLDAITGTVPVELEFVNGPKLLPGTVTKVELILNESEKIIVPEKALYYSGNKIFIPLLENGVVKKVEVKTRPASSGQIEILEGLSAGTQMVVGSGEFLKDGDKVEILKK